MTSYTRRYTQQTLNQVISNARLMNANVDFTIKSGIAGTPDVIIALTPNEAGVRIATSQNGVCTDITADAIRVLVGDLRTYDQVAIEVYKHGQYLGSIVINCAPRNKLIEVEVTNYGEE